MIDVPVPTMPLMVPATSPTARMKRRFKIVFPANRLHTKPCLGKYLSYHCHIRHRLSPLAARQGNRRLRGGVPTAELDERVARVEQLGDAELMQIARSGHGAESVTPLSRLLTVGTR
jgi:hypothetical protein